MHITETYVRRPGNIYQSQRPINGNNRAIVAKRIPRKRIGDRWIVKYVLLNFIRTTYPLPRTWIVAEPTAKVYFVG
jgi:hypothetical protein